MKRLYITLLFIISVGLSQTALASGEVIHSFDSRLELSKDGKLNVTETIKYDFGDTSGHGIYRVIPTNYIDDKGNTYSIKFELISVLDALGRPMPTNINNQDKGTRIKIGDANKTVTGPQQYIITYTLQPIIRQGDNLDRLAYNVTGNEWAAPIESATATLITNFSTTDMRCFTGATGKTDKNCSVKLQEAGMAKYYQTTSGLAAKEGLSIEADFAAKSFDQYVVAVAPKPWNLANVIGLVAYGLILLGFACWPLWQRFKNWRIKKQQVIIAQYEAPNGLAAGELGYLLDNKVGMREITAMLIEVAVAGYIKIERVEKRVIFKFIDYSFTKLKDFADLSPEKRDFLNSIFDGSPASGMPDVVHMKDLDSQEMKVAVQKYKQSLKESLKNKGYFQKNQFAWKWFVPMVLLTLPLLKWLILLGVFLLFFEIALGTYHILTPAGLTEWAGIAGFKEFLSVTEADRLKFTDAPDKSPALFSKLLPAAIALGVENQWARQFESMDVSQATGWYVGNQPFTAVALASDLGGGFSSAVSSSFTPRASSTSSSSGGGGFSGGGMGGGGGGSW